MAFSNEVAPSNPTENDDQKASDQLAGNKSSCRSTEFQLRKYLLLLATLVATVTYVAGLNLPGGAWQETEDGHHAGDPILQQAHHRRYLAFYYCNATAFAASLVVSLLLCWNKPRHGVAVACACRVRVENIACVRGWRLRSSLLGL